MAQCVWHFGAGTRAVGLAGLVAGDGAVGFRAGYVFACLCGRPAGVVAARFRPTPPASNALISSCRRLNELGSVVGAAPRSEDSVDGSNAFVNNFGPDVGQAAVVVLESAECCGARLPR